MKKVVIPVVAILVVGIGALIFGMSMSYAKVQYQKDTEAHVVSAQDGDVIATYAGQTTVVSPGNLTRVVKVLTISERRQVFFKPDCDMAGAVVVVFPDGAQYAVVPDTSAADAAYICYTDDGKDQWFRVEGYGAMDWMTRAVSPEGIYEANEAVEP